MTYRPICSSGLVVTFSRMSALCAIATMLLHTTTPPSISISHFFLFIAVAMSVFPRIYSTVSWVKVFSIQIITLVSCLPSICIFYAKISTQVTGTHFKQTINCVPGSGVELKSTLTLAWSTATPWSVLNLLPNGGGVVMKYGILCLKRIPTNCLVIFCSKPRLIWNLLVAEPPSVQLNFMNLSWTCSIWNSSPRNLPHWQHPRLLVVNPRYLFLIYKSFLVLKYV